MKLKEALKRIADLEARIAVLENGVQIHVNHWHHKVNSINVDPIRYDPFPVTCCADRASGVSVSPNGVAFGLRAMGASALS